MRPSVRSRSADLKSTKTNIRSSSGSGIGQRTVDIANNPAPSRRYLSSDSNQSDLIYPDRFRSYRSWSYQRWSDRSWATSAIPSIPEGELTIDSVFHRSLKLFQPILTIQPVIQGTGSHYRA